MKEQILTYLNMKDILDRYGIKHRGSQFCCPFHGTDKHPSAKAYEKSFIIAVPCDVISRHGWHESDGGFG